MNVEANIKEYISGSGQNEGVQPSERYTSFDYCFNYFQAFRERGVIEQLAEPRFMQISCLQLGFYLASWGMLRGSAPLLQKSIRFYQTLIRYIANAPKKLWEIDANTYTPQNIRLLLECRKKIGQALAPCGASDILATKIMLGVFGNVPAFDTYFKNGFQVWSFGGDALAKIRGFYRENQEIIENYRIPTFDFFSGQKTKRVYTRAKVVDMIFFIEGSKTN